MTTSNHNDDDQEMSMDEILASIRRYVSPDEPAQKVEPTQKDEQKPLEPLLGRPQLDMDCLLYTSPSPRDRTRSRMPSSA